MYLQLASWAPTGLVRGEHGAFMADLTAMMFQNGIDVAFHISMETNPEEAYMDARMKGNVRQADLMFFMHWNYWGPLGKEDKAIYMAGFRAMLAQIPGQEFIPPDECEAIRQLFEGDIAGCIFDVPLNPYERATEAAYAGRPVAVVREGQLVLPYEHQPMTLSRLGVATERLMVAAVPAMMFHPATSSVIAVKPQYK